MAGSSTPTRARRLKSQSPLTNVRLTPEMQAGVLKFKDDYSAKLRFELSAAETIRVLIQLGLDHKEEVLRPNMTPFFGEIP